MYHERAKSFEALTLFADAACIAAALGVALFLRLAHADLPFLGAIPSTPWAAEKAVRSEYALLLAANLLVWTAYLRRSRLYARGGADRLARVASVYGRAMLLCVFATGAVVFALKMNVSRLLFGYFFVAMVALLLVKQGVVVAILRRVGSTAQYARHALIIGEYRPAVWFADVVGRTATAGYRLVGLLLSSPWTPDTSSDDAPPVVGRVEDLDRVLADFPVDDVFIVGSAGELSQLSGLAQTLIERGRVVSLVSTLSSGTDGVRGRVTEFDGVPMISFGPMPRDEIRSVVKRTIDVGVSVIGLVLSAPLMTVIAAAIKIATPGPILFRQQRLGVGGRPFSLYKFRSMRVDAEQVLRADPTLYRRYVENDYKLPESEDPRISRLGRFLRTSSLDELPQLWNVLRGDMSLVGPRPIVPAEIEHYAPYENVFLSAQPGLTGHWQVSGRSDVQYPERAYLDLDYVGGHSLMTDISIIARTVPAVLRRKGAY